MNYGQPPAGGISQRLPRAIGVLRAKYLLYTGDSVNARDAERIGLVNQVVPPDNLMSAVEELAKKILSKSHAALNCVKYLVNEGGRLDLKAGLDMELNNVHNYVTTCEDAMEGLMAFFDKRKASSSDI
jgi:enoyl-CoA hydratase